MTIFEYNALIQEQIGVREAQKASHSANQAFLLAADKYQLALVRAAKHVVETHHSAPDWQTKEEVLSSLSRSIEESLSKIARRQRYIDNDCSGEF